MYTACGSHGCFRASKPLMPSRRNGRGGRPPEVCPPAAARTAPPFAPRGAQRQWPHHVHTSRLLFTPPVLTSRLLPRRIAIARSLLEKARAERLTVSGPPSPACAGASSPSMPSKGAPSMSPEGNASPAPQCPPCHHPHRRPSRHPPPARLRPRPQRSGRAPRSVAAASRSPPAWLAEELCGARLPERVSPSASPVGRPLEEQESARACTHSGADLGAHAPTWAPT